MHTIKLTIHDSIYDKLMGLLDILPNDKVSVVEDSSYPEITFDEAKTKVTTAINNIEKDKGLSLDAAFNKVLHS